MDTVTDLVVMDAPQWRHLDDRLRPLQAPGVSVAVWDHHDVPGDMESAKAQYSAAEANIAALVEEIRRRDIEITPMAATLFLAGL